MNVTSVSTARGADQKQAQAMKAGAQFEAILLNMVFGDLQKAFSQLPGANEDGIMKSYDGFGMEALTSGLARNRGIGLGAFITHALLARKEHNEGGV
jgi:Rod binding domain-containing protein